MLSDGFGHRLHCGVDQIIATETGRDSPMASAIGFIAADQTEDFEGHRDGLSDGFGHRLHCGVMSDMLPLAYANSPMASAIGFIAAAMAAPSTAGLADSPMASAIGFIAASDPRRS